jgi:hypothetical protein
MFAALAGITSSEVTGTAPMSAGGPCPAPFAPIGAVPLSVGVPWSAPLDPRCVTFSSSKAGVGGWETFEFWYGVFYGPDRATLSCPYTPEVAG